MCISVSVYWLNRTRFTHSIHSCELIYFWHRKWSTKNLSILWKPCQFICVHLIISKWWFLHCFSVKNICEQNMYAKKMRATDWKFINWSCDCVSKTYNFQMTNSHYYYCSKFRKIGKFKCKMNAISLWVIFLLFPRKVILPVLIEDLNRYGFSSFEICSN